MLFLRNITQFPSYLNKRNVSVRIVAFERVNIEKGENSITFTGVTRKSGYHPQIEVQLVNGLISVQSPVKITCDCESFKFEFSFTVNRSEGLLGELPELPGKTMFPKQKNPHMVVSGCKHLIKLAQYILRFQGRDIDSIK